MKNFIVFFDNSQSCESLSEMKEELSKVSSKLSNDPSVEIKSIGYVQQNDLIEVAKLVSKLLKKNKQRLNYLFVINNALNIFHVYRADGKLSDIKKEIIPIIREIYLKKIDTKLSIKKFQDERLCKGFTDCISS